MHKSILKKNVDIDMLKPPSGSPPLQSLDGKETETNKEKEIENKELGETETNTYTVRNWDEFFEEKVEANLEDRTLRGYLAGKSIPSEVTFVLLHGAGLTSLSWALCVKQLKDKCRVLALDLRGHGESTISANDQLTMGSFCADVSTAINQLLPTQPLVLVGHSLGGAIAVKVASGGGLGKRLQGVIVIDMVGEVVTQSRKKIINFLRKRPKDFPSLQSAVKWSVESGQLQSEEVAGISIPPQLRQTADDRWTWRTDLSLTVKHWDEWFEDLSRTFLSCGVPKVLMLSGVDLLDKELTIAQIQGKYQLIILPHSGHFINEDNAAATAQHMITFYNRLKLIFKS